MHYYIIAVIVTAVLLDRCFAEVPLELGVSQIVMFDDEEMQVRVRNPHGANGEVVFCFEGSPDLITALCPQGYAQLYVSLSHRQKVVTYYINHQGRVKKNPIIVVEGKIKFRDDGSIKVLVHEQLSAMSVSVVNAKVFIPVEEKPKKNERSYKTLYLVILGLALLAVLIIVAVIVWLCCCTKRLTPSITTGSTTADREGVKLLSVKPKPSTPLANKDNLQ